MLENKPLSITTSQCRFRGCGALPSSHTISNIPGSLSTWNSIRYHYPTPTSRLHELRGYSKPEFLMRRTAVPLRSASPHTSSFKIHLTLPWTITLLCWKKLHTSMTMKTRVTTWKLGIPLTTQIPTVMTMTMTMTMTATTLTLISTLTKHYNFYTTLQYTPLF